MAATMIETKADLILVSFTERRLLDTRIVRQTGRELQAAVSPSLPRNLLISFRGVSHLSTSMINELITLNKTCNAAGVTLKFCDVPPQIMEVFNLLNLHELIEIQATEDAAVKSFGNKRFLG